MASDRRHNSIDKACDALGLELIVVEADRATHALTLEALRRQLAGVDEDLLGSAALVLTAGTVAVGAVDDLAMIRALRAGGSPRFSPAWVHVDSAWLGACMLSDELAPLLSGVQDADSCCFSAHKWLYQPKGSAVVLFRDAESQRKISYGAPTGLPPAIATPTVGLLGSAPTTSMPLLATLLSMGRRGVAERIEADVRKATALAALAREDDEFEVFEGRAGDAGRTGVVAWRPKAFAPDAISMHALRSSMEAAWVSLATIDGVTWFRSVAANPNADPRLVLEEARRAVARVGGRAPPGG